MKLTFTIATNFTHLYVSLQPSIVQPLLASLQYTFNALAGTNTLNQNSLNVIDCVKLRINSCLAHLYVT